MVIIHNLINYANPTNEDIKSISNRLLYCTGTGSANLLKQEISQAYQQGISDTQNKFYDQVKDVFTSQEFADIFNGDRKPPSSAKQNAVVLNPHLKRARELFKIGDTARSIDAILCHLEGIYIV